MAWHYEPICAVYQCESSEMAKRLADECKVPIYTFNNWRSGWVRIPELAKDKIEEVAGVKIFERE